MKILILMAFTLLSSIGFAQSDVKAKKVRGYKAEIFFLDDTTPIRGYLYEATDSSIVIIPINSKNKLIDKDSKVEVPITQIKKIKKPFKSTALSVGIPGFAVGFFLGGVITAFKGNGNGSFSVGGGLITGIILGGLFAVAVTSTTYRINGDTEKYRKKYLKTLRYKSSLFKFI